ncbi:hypothetical protein [Paenibacillus arenilitoris]|uniref:Ferric siderophore reductase C-terminal domain-containing protein n=1 Tax=Paenibacillus arenilitoris TaxID=2772299 RepID=A0A927H461_9BACL|nr:hypothetical protein [Paenibacillus arenilitoris]MBD2868066.1 hypothetical protein [Paenibacillus arenilitoris]
MSDKMLDILESRYEIFVSDRDNIAFSCPASELLDAGKLKKLLELYTPMVKGTEQAVGEVYMTSWFRGPMLGLLYMLSAWNRSLDLSLDNLTVQIYSSVYNGKSYYRCGFLMDRSEWREGPAEQDANAEWAKEEISRFFEHTVRPVFETIASVGTQKTAMLWSQLPTSLEYGFDLMMNSEESESVKELARRNYGLAKALEGERFGRSKNPLDVKFRMTESMTEEGKQVRMKFGCCLYYLVEDGYYCFTCPRLKESERDRRRAEFRAAKQAEKQAQ